MEGNTSSQPPKIFLQETKAKMEQKPQNRKALPNDKKGRICKQSDKKITC